MVRPKWFESQKIIDFRLRPPFEDLLKLRIWDESLRASFARKMRVQQAPSALQTSVDLLVTEMDDLNVAMGVANARADGREGVGSASNDSLCKLQNSFAGRFRCFGSVDLNDKEWATKAEHAIATLKLIGISIDPGFFRPVVAVDDRRVHDLAELCAHHGALLMITLSVIAGPHVDDAKPSSLDRLAEAHPKTTIVVAHACWPYFAEATAVAFRRSNVFLVPDMYIVGFPGAADMVTSINGIIRDQVLFGSAYPSAPIADCIDAYWKLGLEDGAAQPFFYGNAARLLGIESQG